MQSTACVVAPATSSAAVSRPLPCRPSERVEDCDGVKVVRQRVTFRSLMVITETKWLS